MRIALFSTDLTLQELLGRFGDHCILLARKYFFLFESTVMLKMM